MKQALQKQTEMSYFLIYCDGTNASGKKFSSIGISALYFYVSVENQTEEYGDFTKDELKARAKSKLYYHLHALGCHDLDMQRTTQHKTPRNNKTYI